VFISIISPTLVEEKSKEVVVEIVPDLIKALVCILGAVLGFNFITVTSLSL